MNRLPIWLAAALVLVGALVLTSCDEPVTASRVDPAFGVGGILALPTDSLWIPAAPLPDGGLLTKEYDHGWVLQRRLATGAIAPGWTAPSVNNGPIAPFFGGLTDGTVLVASVRGTADVIARHSPSGTPMVDLGTVSRPTGLHSYALDGDRLVVSTPCDANGSCGAVAVDVFGPDGSVARTTVPFSGLAGLPGEPCSRGQASQARLSSDGSILVAAAWCSSAPGAPSVVVRRLTGQTIDRTYGGGVGYAGLTGMPSDVLISRTGQVTIRSGSVLHRLASTGRPDEVFGTVDLAAMIGTRDGDPRFWSVVPNGNGFSIGSKGDQRACSTAPVLVTHLGADGRRVGPQASFADGMVPTLQPYPDGSLLVGSSTWSPSPAPSTSCGQPVLYGTLRKLLP